MAYSDDYNLRTSNVKFNDVADAIDDILTRNAAGTTTGTANTYLATPTPAWTGYVTSSLIIVIPHVDNTGSSTLNVSGLGAKTIKRGGANIGAGALKAGFPVVLVYDGNDFELLLVEGALTPDGSTNPTADLPMNGFKHTGVGNAVANDQYAAYGQLLSAVSASIPTGTVQMFAGSSAPTGFLLCSGAAVSRTTYADLFNVIGTTYGAGDNVTTFNLPDLRGRVAAGLDNMGGTDAGRLSWTNALGTNGGAQTHTLTTGELAQHSHTYSGTTTTTGSGHSHALNVDEVGQSGSDRFTFRQTGPTYITQAGGIGLVDPTSGTHTHTYSGTTANAGSNTAHNNMQPTILLNYIIKT